MITIGLFMKMAKTAVHPFVVPKLMNNAGNEPYFNGV